MEEQKDEKIAGTLAAMFEATERAKNPVLTIVKDNSVKYTRYVTMGLKNSVDEKFFEYEGKTRPLQVAKNWAKEKGYKYLELISLTLKKPNKMYEL